METYRNYLFYEQKGILWTIKHCQVENQLEITGICSFYNTEFRKVVKKDCNLLFGLFSDFTKGCLDTNKYTIDFPKEIRFPIGIKVVLLNEKETLNISLESYSPHQNTFEYKVSVYDKMKTINYFANEIDRIENKFKRYQDETNDKFALLGDFLETIDNNKLNSAGKR